MIPLPPSLIIGAVVSVGVLGLGLYAKIEHNRLERCKTEFVEFKAAAKALSDIQVAENKRLKEQYEGYKRETDKKVTALRNDNVALNERLHDDRERSRSSPLPYLAARAPSPERACVSGSELDRAIQRLDESLRAARQQLDDELSPIVRHGDQERISLDGVKEWAAKLPKED